MVITNQNKSKSKQASKILIIVESPSKAKVISKYLGSKYRVIASVGHVRDLPKSRLAVDINNDFEPEYINIRGKASIIKELRLERAKASQVYLATDPDREGEAIAWHLSYLLDIDISEPCRVEFHEINKSAVLEGLSKPRPIDMDLVDAQQARRILDRLVGYQISPLLWAKVRRGLSGGRVQSAALKLICDREQLIQSFEPEEYWEITADFGDGFEAELWHYLDDKIEINTESEARAIEKAIHEVHDIFTVSSLKDGTRSYKPFAPFTTSSMQQDASTRLGFTASKTMQVAQQLYEGINIKGLGARGLVTYIRTDSVRISEQAKTDARSYILEHFGKEYTADNIFTNKNKAMQDAHEAIRPSDITLEPDALRDDLTPDQFKLYDLIWRRFLASQMASAVYNTSQLILSSGDYQFKAAGSTVSFIGWRKIYPVLTESESTIPSLKEGETLEAKAINSEQKFTKPPARFTEASLVKELEEQNIGRPSTYASIISVLVMRYYIKRDKKTLIPTDLGFSVIAILQEFFADIVSTEFTGQMEDNLDSVELGKSSWRDVIKDFYLGFSEELKVAEAEAAKAEAVIEPSDEVCELCGRQMVYKDGRFGRFLACSGYPDCKNTKPIVKSTGVKCPKCGKDIIERRGRKSGKIFYGCSGYPDCDLSYWDLPTGEFCPKCSSMLLQSKGKNPKIKCSNPDCDYTQAISNDKE